MKYNISKLLEEYREEGRFTVAGFEIRERRDGSWEYYEDVGAPSDCFHEIPDSAGLSPEHALILALATILDSTIEDLHATQSSADVANYTLFQIQELVAPKTTVTQDPAPSNDEFAELLNGAV